jgi:type IV pilus assembly protein PilV
MMTTASIRNQRGFSLIEALIAMVLLSIGLLGTGLLQIGGLKANANAAGRTSGVAVAQSVLDDLRSIPQNDDRLADGDLDGAAGLDDGRAAGGSAPNPAAADRSWNGTGQYAAADGRTYTVFWNVAEDVPMAGTRTLRLFVYWNDPKFGLNKVVMTTVVGGYYL